MFLGIAHFVRELSGVWSLASTEVKRRLGNIKISNLNSQILNCTYCTPLESLVFLLPNTIVFKLLGLLRSEIVINNANLS
jgi:hypothetical protein